MHNCVNIIVSVKHGSSEHYSVKRLTIHALIQFRFSVICDLSVSGESILHIAFFLKIAHCVYTKGRCHVVD